MNVELLDRCKNSPQLPSLPTVAIRVLELAKQTNAGMGDLAKVISSDPALSARILKTANSSFYGLAKPASSINQALVILGLQSVKTLALGFSLVSGLTAQKSPGFNYLQFWRQSLYSAIASRSLAKALHTGQHEEAFLAGLLSDIGTLVMHCVLGPEYDVLLQACQGNQVKLVLLSREKFDLDHAQVGGILAEHWKLPPVLVEPIRRHHSLSGADAKSNSLTHVVYAGVLCGQVFAAEVTGLLPMAREHLDLRFDFTHTQMDDLFAEIDSQTTQFADFLDVGPIDGRSLSAIQEEARQTLMDLTFQAQVHSRAMQTQNEQLQIKATIDGLTKLANRARFDEFLGNAFAESFHRRAPLALLFLDIDKFKTVNDTHGHQAGDEVLIRLGRLLSTFAAPTDLAARYGGEELAIILRGRDSLAAATLAETIRQAIEHEQILFAGKTIPVSASIGIAATDDPSIQSPTRLIAAADQALYAAKQAGRNRVQIHSQKRAANSHGTGSGSASPGRSFTVRSP